MEHLTPLITLSEKTYYTAKLSVPQKPGGQLCDEKKGCLYKGEYRNSPFEINLCPFPGLSDWELEETCEQFEEVVAQINAQNEMETNHVNPHVDYALHFIRYQQEGNLINQTNVKENLLLSSKELIQLLAQEIDTIGVVKIKIRPSSLEDQNFLMLLELLKKTSPTKLRLRLDANTGLTRGELLNFWDKFKEEDLCDFIDYFEEPLNSYEAYQNLPDDLPYAHEEYLEYFLIEPSSAVALVLKPTQTGVTLLEMSALEHPERRLIISSAFDLDQELNYLRDLAQKFGAEEFHGLKVFTTKKSLSQTKSIKF